MARVSGRVGSHSVVGEVEVGGNEVICPKVAGPSDQLSPGLGQGTWENRLTGQSKGRDMRHYNVWELVRT